MNKVKKRVRVLKADSVSDAIVRDYKDLVEKYPLGVLAKDANLAAIIAEIERLSKEITTAIRRDKIKTNLKELDQARDQAISNLFNLITGYLAFPDPQKQEAARKLTDISVKYKGIRNSGYSDKSVLTESLLEDLSADSLADSIVLLDGIQTRIDELRTALSDFYKENSKLNQQMLNQGASASEIKDPLLNLINDRLIPYISALQPVEGYQEFARLCELEINSVNASVSKKKSDVTEESDASEGDDSGDDA